MNNKELRTGDVLHCTRKSLISYLIRLVTKSKISHTSLFIELYGVKYIVEAQKNGVNLKPFDRWVLKYKYEYIVSRPLVINEHELKVKALSVAGITGYDFESFLFRKPKEILTKRWVYRQNEHEKMFCSEFVAWCFDIVNSEKLTPKELFIYMSKSNDFKNI